jgi:hypothetical protein
LIIQARSRLISASLILCAAISMLRVEAAIAINHNARVMYQRA